MLKRVHWVLTARSSNKVQVSTHFFSWTDVKSWRTAFSHLGLLTFSWRARWTVSHEAPVSVDHFLTSFLGFARTARNILAPLWMTGVLLVADSSGFSRCCGTSWTFCSTSCERGLSNHEISWVGDEFEQQCSRGDGRARQRCFGRRESVPCLGLL